MYRFSLIMVVLTGLLWAGGMFAQDRRGAGRDRGERRAPRVERGREVQRVPGQANRVPGGVRREQRVPPGRSAPSPLMQQRGERRAPSGFSGAPQQGGKGYHELFGTVQRGLASGSAAAFSGSLAPQVYVNLRGGESGYYSANQAHYVLENYFKSRRLVNVKFSTIGESDANPYATGSATFVERGTRRLAQVYVSLTRSGERWIITQINIY